MPTTQGYSPKSSQGAENLKFAATTYAMCDKWRDDKRGTETMLYK